MSTKKSMLVLVFKLNTDGDMAKHLRNTFTKIASDYARIDDIFYLYINSKIKETERFSRNSAGEISANIFGSEQQLPINTKKLWAVSKNKMKLEISSLTGLLKIILKLFLSVLVDHIMDRLPAILSFQMES